LWKSSLSGELTYFARSGSSAEAGDPAARVRERKHEPPREVVVAAPVGEAGGAQLVLREPAGDRLLCQCRPRRGEPESELAARLLAEGPAGEVFAHGTAGRRLPEASLVVPCRLLEQREESVAAFLALLLARREFLVLELNVEAVGQPLDRADETDAFRLLDEPDGVSPRPAPEAVIRALVRTDGKARRALVVERAEARMARAGFAQPRARGDDGDDVGGPTHGLDGFVLDSCHQRGSAPDANASAKRSVIPAM
jgi:hypothetical protein